MTLPQFEKTYRVITEYPKFGDHNAKHGVKLVVLIASMYLARKRLRPTKYNPLDKGFMWGNLNLDIEKAVQLILYPNIQYKLLVKDVSFHIEQVEYRCRFDRGMATVFQHRIGHPTQNRLVFRCRK